LIPIKRLGQKLSGSATLFNCTPNANIDDLSSGVEDQPALLMSTREPIVVSDDPVAICRSVAARTIGTKSRGDCPHDLISRSLVTIRTPPASCCIHFPIPSRLFHIHPQRRTSNPVSPKLAGNSSRRTAYLLRLLQVGEEADFYALFPVKVGSFHDLDRVQAQPAGEILFSSENSPRQAKRST
jgi:hypothetical protein